MRRPVRWLLWGVGGWYAWRLFGPEPIPRFAPPQHNPLHLTGRTVMVGEHEMFVREGGPPDAPALVLVHGWNLDGGMTFFRIIPGLAEQFHLIVPDLRNHGRSDWVRGPVDVVDLADDVAGVLDALGIAGATVLGYSMGGMVVQELARRHPRHVGRMILAATAARPIPKVRLPARVAFWLARSGLRLSSVEAARVTGELLYRGGSLPSRHRRWMHEALMKRDPDLYYEIGAAVWRFDSRNWVGTLRPPAMVIIPTADEVVPPETQYELAGLLPEAELVELDGGFHESVMNRAAEYVAVISRFAG
jgi:3-oxoadipate enol-lactonase